MATKTHPLAKHVGSRKNVQIDRDLEQDPSVSGYVLAVGDELALLHTFDDFEPDGYMLIRMDDVEDVVRGDEEKHWDTMLEGEGLLGGLDTDFEIDLCSWEAAIADVHERFGPMIVECEDRDEDEDEETSYVGRVSEITDRSVVLETVDGTGRWDDEPEEIPFMDITAVQFGTPYLERFWKYVEEEE